MTLPPGGRYAIVGREVLASVANESYETRVIVERLVTVLAHGPYPGSPLLHATELRGFPPDHFLCVYDHVMIAYMVSETAPVKMVLLLDIIVA